MPPLPELFGLPVDEAALAPLVGDLRQLASVRRFVLDDGPETGVRGLAFDTGGGLAFWALIDRSLDLGTLHWRGVQLAWQGPAGFRSPALHDAESENGAGIHRGFGGLVVTCGLEHTRQPRDGHPLHGRLPFTPARLTGYGEVWDAPEPYLFAEGEVIQAASGGERWRLLRRIEAPIGGSLIRLTDRVQNRSPDPRPQPILYHINLGFPLVTPKAEVSLDGEPLGLDLSGLGKTRGPVVTCRRAAAAGWSRCRIRGPVADLTIGFETTALPWLQTWVDPSPGMHVLGIEPCNTDRGPDARNVADGAIALSPGESRIYRLEFSLA